MSSSPNDPETIISRTQVTTNTTEVTGSKRRVDELRSDFNRFGKGTLHSIGGFRTFILRGNVVDLAIGIVIGAAFTSVVTALVSDVITPLIPISKNSNLSTWTVQLYYAKIQLGAFINAVISFLIVAAIIYFFVVQPVNALMARYNPPVEEIPPATQDCPYCFQSINIQATRCPYCTSQLTEQKAAPVR